MYYPNHLECPLLQKQVAPAPCAGPRGGHDMAHSILLIWVWCPIAITFLYEFICPFVSVQYTTVNVNVYQLCFAMS